VENTKPLFLTDAPPRHVKRPYAGTRRRATPRADHTSGGTGTKVTSPTPRPTRSGSRCRTPERPPFGNAMASSTPFSGRPAQDRQCAQQGRPLGLRRASLRRRSMPIRYGITTLTGGRGATTAQAKEFDVRSRSEGRPEGFHCLFYQVIAC
jgi:hypothetical protein